VSAPTATIAAGSSVPPTRTTSRAPRRASAPATSGPSPPPAAITGAPARCWRTRSTASIAAARRSTRRRRVALAATLLALDRGDDARREAAAALDRLVALGAAGEAEGARRLLGADEPLHGLTPREREVLSLLAQGLTNRQIGARLVISEHTVHRHVSSILRKLEVPSRAAAAAVAVRAG
jgi:DNA-binding NarL/FixJ family response regulator